MVTSLTVRKTYLIFAILLDEFKSLRKINVSLECRNLALILHRHRYHNRITVESGIVRDRESIISKTIDIGKIIPSSGRPIQFHGFFWNIELSSTRIRETAC